MKRKAIHINVLMAIAIARGQQFIYTGPFIRSSF